jgi:hypothetical protein
MYYHLKKEVRTWQELLPIFGMKEFPEATTARIPAAAAIIGQAVTAKAQKR